jgi:uncharacterized lipoprotein YbaY
VPPTREPNSGRSLAGVVRLDRAERLDGAVLIVALHDVTYVDAPSRVVAERRYDALSGIHSEIPFYLAVPAALPSGASYALKAEIRRSDRNELMPGDYLSTAAHPWMPGETRAVILVRRI